MALSLQAGSHLPSPSLRRTSGPRLPGKGSCSGSTWCPCPSDNVSLEQPCSRPHLLPPCMTAWLLACASLSVTLGSRAPHTCKDGSGHACSQAHWAVADGVGTWAGADPAAGHGHDLLVRKHLLQGNSAAARAGISSLI